MLVFVRSMRPKLQSLHRIADALDIIDNARGAKISGSGFPVYKGAGSALQRALIMWFLDVHTRENGFVEIWPPAVVNRTTEQQAGSGLSSGAAAAQNL